MMFSCKENKKDTDIEAFVEYEEIIEIQDSVENIEVTKIPEDFHKLLNGKITEKVTVILDKQYEKLIDKKALEEAVKKFQIREADEFDKPQAAENWWEDYQDVSQTGYYSAEHVFGERSPYAGKTFMPHVFSDIVYTVDEVNIKFEDLSSLRKAFEEKKRTEKEDGSGKEWTLLCAGCGLSFAKSKYQYDDNEMIILVPYFDAYKDKNYGYYFIEEDYAKQRNFGAYYFNTPFNEWPEEMQKPESLKAFNFPIWMHFAALNGEYNPEAKRFELFPNFRIGGYDGVPIYIVDSTKDSLIPDAQEKIDFKSIPDHYYLDEL
jgi:hypothetical protein